MSNLPNTQATGNGAQPKHEGKAEIEHHVRQALSKIASKADDVSAAREQYDTEREDAIGEREAIITTLAQAAIAGSWEGDDIDTAVKAVLDSRNDNKSPSVKTFASEVKRCCRATVRGHIANYFKIAHAAWDAEGAQEGDGVKPLRKAFSRCYHLVVTNLAKEGNDNRRYYETEQDLVNFALRTLRDREIDYTRVSKRLKAIVKELRAFHADFPVEGIQTCVEYLDEVTADELKSCNPSNQYKPDTTPTPASEPEVASEPEPEDDELDASDPVEDALRGMIEDAPQLQAA
jgi:hypothetical protein